MIRLSKKIFGTLFFSIFSVVTGVGIVVPLLPVYAHDLGAGGLYIGLIFGAFSLSRIVFMPYFGRLSDKKGRKPYIVAGLAGYAVISLAFMASTDVKALILIRLIQGVASAMIMPIAQAYIGDITPAGREGFTMGVFNMSVFCGLSVGPLLGGIINSRFGLNPAFASLGALAFLSFVLSLLLLPPTRSEQVLVRGKKVMRWRKILKDRDLAVLFIFRLAYTICIGIIWSFMPVFADIEFSLSSSSIGVLIMLGVFISGLIHTPVGYLADRVNRNFLVVGGGLITTLAVLSFEWAQGFKDLFVANVLFGLGGGISMPALMALAVAKGHRSNAMGSIMAVLTVAHSLGMLLGSVLGGLAMDLLHLKQAFVFGALFMIAGVVIFSISSFRPAHPGAPR